MTDLLQHNCYYDIIIAYINFLLQMMSDYLFGTGMDETIRAQNLYNKTYFYVFNYKSRYDYLPTWRGISFLPNLFFIIIKFYYY